MAEQDVDLAAYFARIRYSGSADPTVKTVATF